MATTIEIYNINNVQPDGFVDRVVTDESPIYDGVFEIALETQDPVRFRDDNTYKIRDVQKIFYPKYKITIPDSTETFWEMLKYSRKVLIFQDGLENQEAVITDVNRTFTNQMWQVVIEYYDRAVNNYTGTVVEYLKSEWLKTTGQDISLYKLYYTDTDYICTRIKPEINYPDPVTEKTKINEIERIDKSVQSEVVKAVFYCSEAEAIALKQNAYKYLLRLSTYSTSKEISNPSVEKLSGWDIYKIEIDYLHNKLIYRL